MTGKKLLTIIGGIILTVVGFVLIPPLVNKCSKKLYRSRISEDNTDFDDMGPEIVKKTKDKETGVEE